MNQVDFLLFKLINKDKLLYYQIVVISISMILKIQVN